MDSCCEDVNTLIYHYIRSLSLKYLPCSHALHSILHLTAERQRQHNATCFSCTSSVYGATFSSPDPPFYSREPLQAVKLRRRSSKLFRSDLFGAAQTAHHHQA